jgi:hypothetical protein
MPADRMATPWDYMFLPDHMMTVFGDAMLRGANNTDEFISADATILEGSDPVSRKFQDNTPDGFFAGVNSGHNSSLTENLRLKRPPCGLTGSFSVQPGCSDCS